MEPLAVAFDLDYTLAVPTRDRTAILHEASRVTGAPLFSRQAYLDAHSRCLTEQTREPIFEALLAEHGASSSRASAGDVARAYRELIAEALVPVEGVEAMLDDLRPTYRIGLLTNGPVVAQQDKLRKLGWVGAFDAELVTGSLAAGKPDRRAFEALLSELGTTPERTVYVGDDVHADVEGATNAGIRAIQVLLEPDADPHPGAVTAIHQEELAERLPTALRSL